MIEGLQSAERCWRPSISELEKIHAHDQEAGLHTLEHELTALQTVEQKTALLVAVYDNQEKKHLLEFNTFQSVLERACANLSPMFLGRFAKHLHNAGFTDMAHFVKDAIASGQRTIVHPAEAIHEVQATVGVHLESKGMLKDIDAVTESTVNWLNSIGINQPVNRLDRDYSQAIHRTVQTDEAEQYSVLKRELRNCIVIPERSSNYIYDPAGLAQCIRDMQYDAKSAALLPHFKIGGRLLREVLEDISEIRTLIFGGACKDFGIQEVSHHVLEVIFRDKFPYTHAALKNEERPEDEDEKGTMGALLRSRYLDITEM